MKDPLARAFLLLVALSAGTTLLAGVFPRTGALLVAAFLLLSGLKARAILNDYLGLAATGLWRRGFTAFLVGFLLLAYGIYLVPLLG